MYVIRADAKILCSDEVRNLMMQYHEKFGERFLPFNYVDFPGDDHHRPAEMYREALQKAVQRDEPTHIVSHRFDTIDH